MDWEEKESSTATTGREIGSFGSNWLPFSLSRNALLAKTFAQCWSLDEAGNWGNFREDDTGSGTWDLVQNRAFTPANEISVINNLVGTAWVTPIYDMNGNMTTLPQPGSPGNAFNGTYDAWNRLVKISAGSLTVAVYQYDGLNRRIFKNRYSAGVLSETRHMFYSKDWQVLEERVGTSFNPDRQFVWGIHYLDDLILRDRDATSGGGLNERLYGIQDPNWKVTAVVDLSGKVQERYGYTGFGLPLFLNGSFGNQNSSNFDWETLFAGYRWDSETGLNYVRNRIYDSNLGTWVQRDPLGLLEVNKIYEYCESNPLIHTDPTGEFVFLLVLAGAAIGAAVGGTYQAIRGGSTSSIILGATGGAILGSIIGLTAGAGYVLLTLSLSGGGVATISMASALAVDVQIGMQACFAVAAAGAVVISATLTTQECIDKFVECSENPWRRRNGRLVMLDCGDCLRFCVAQKRWPDDRCPL